MSPLATALAQPGRPLFADAAGDIAVSFEFFPPKTEKMEATLWESVKTLEPLRPRFVSVTYGAGGSTRERTHATVVRIQRETSAPRRRAPHLRRGEPRRDRRHRPRLLGRRHPPHRRAARRPARARQGLRRRIRDGYANAAALVAGLKKVAPFEISVACYPECHPDSAERGRRPRQSQAQDRRRRRPRDHPVLLLARLLLPLPRRGSPRPASTPRSCRASCRSPTSPRPASSPALCGAAIPPWLDRLFEGLDDLPAARQLVAATLAAELCAQLYAGGVAQLPFLHAQPRRAQLRDLPPARPQAAGTRRDERRRTA